MTTLNTGRTTPSGATDVKNKNDNSTASGSSKNHPNISGNNKNSEKESTTFSEIISFFKTLAIFLVLAFFLRASVVEAFKIPSGSMRPTLIEGDHILVSKFSYGFRIPFMREVVFSYAQPKLGDVVVFTRPDDPASLEDDSEINIIKRVAGLPGNEVRIQKRKLYIDGVPLNESYAQWLENGPPEGEFGPQIVPEGHVFLLGDNRDKSKDSRFWTEHFLDMKFLKGRALVIYWSWDSLSRIGTLIR